VQSSTARLRHRAQTGLSATAARAAASSGQTAMIAQTPQFGRGVKPSPVPEPQSFQNKARRSRRNTSRAAPICPMIQSRDKRPSNRKRLRVATGMAHPPAFDCQVSLTFYAGKGKRKDWISARNAT
jgi:hypothetical protein